VPVTFERREARWYYEQRRVRRGRFSAESFLERASAAHCRRSVTLYGVPVGSKASSGFSPDAKYYRLRWYSTRVHVRCRIRVRSPSTTQRRSGLNRRYQSSTPPVLAYVRDE
jgi:hypothetical protein